MKKKILVVSAVIFIFLILVLLLSRPCDWYWLTDGFVMPIEFQLPRGFKGRIFLIYDKKDGAEVIVKDKKYIINIPPNGIFKIKPIPRLSDPATKLSALRYDGISTFIIRDRSCTIKGKTVHTLLVGTRKEIDERMTDSGNANELLETKIKHERGNNSRSK